MANFNIKTKSKQLNDDRFEIHLSVCVLTQIDIFVSDDIIVASRLAFQTLFFHTYSLSQSLCVSDCSATFVRIVQLCSLYANYIQCMRSNDSCNFDILQAASLLLAKKIILYE